MPLLDHFHTPLSEHRRWESFHARWAVELADQLERDLLPAGYFAEVQVHVGGRVEVDVATSRGRSSEDDEGSPLQEGFSTATATAPPRIWTPPAPDTQLPAIFPDVVELLVFNSEAGLTLVGAVELVSPGNKDRPESRRAFAAKCASYLQDGIGLVVVDIVTNRRANLHNEMVALFQLGDGGSMPGDPHLYATAYRPVRRPSIEATDAWMARLAVGEPLPTLPLALRNGPCLPVALEESYAGLCGRIRLA